VHPDNAALSVSVVHLLPFHVFGLSEDASDVRAIIDAVNGATAGAGPKVVMGDFNLGDRTPLLQDRMESLFAGVPTRPSGACHDDILTDCSSPRDNRVSERTATDHTLLAATLDVLNCETADGAAR
jgi:hypothetical protein